MLSSRVIYQAGYITLAIVVDNAAIIIDVRNGIRSKATIKTIPLTYDKCP